MSVPDQLLATQGQIIVPTVWKSSNLYVVQGMISHVITSHVKLEGQSAEGAAGSMLKLQKAYESWQAALLATQQPMSI